MAGRKDKPEPDPRDQPTLDEQMYRPPEGVIINETPSDLHEFLDGRVMMAAGDGSFKLDLGDGLVIDLIDDDIFASDRDEPREVPEHTPPPPITRPAEDPKREPTYWFHEGTLFRDVGAGPSEIFDVDDGWQHIVPSEQDYNQMTRISTEEAERLMDEWRSAE